MLFKPLKKMSRNRKRPKQDNKITYKSYTSDELDDVLGSDEADKVIDEMLMRGCTVSELFARFGLNWDDKRETNTKTKTRK